MSLASVKRQAQAAADLFDACADALDRGIPLPVSPSPVRTLVFARWCGELVREDCTRITAPGTPWQAVPEPDALRTAARSLRRNPDGVGREPVVPKSDAGLEEATRLVGDRWPSQWREGNPAPNGRGGRIDFRGIADALKCYRTPEAALEALNRQLAAIDPDDYPPAAVKRWQGLASDLALLLTLIERESGACDAAA